MIKYSIIIPFYNVKDYIVECAKSIHNQTYKNFEALFVDDGSKDESRVILEKYLNDNKLVYSIHESIPFESTQEHIKRIIDKNKANIIFYGFITVIVIITIVVCIVICKKWKR